jgi:hypothetical protein
MDNWQEILEAYARGPELLSRTLEDIPEEFLELALDEENWSIREIIHHIVEGDDLFIPFIKQALGGLGGEYQMGWYFEKSQIEWGNCWGFDRRSIETALVLFTANRKHTCSILAGVENPWDYKLTISWPDQSPTEYNIPDIMNIHIRHLDEHLSEIQDIVQLHQSL